MIVFAPYAHASPAGAGLPNDNRSASGTSSTTSTQAVSPDPAWLAAKNAFRVRSGVRPNQPKGTASHPFILAQTQLPCCGGGPPTSAILDTTAPDNKVTTDWEPSNGQYSNYGPGMSHNDDSGAPYAVSTGDADFFGMCGPGAADNALWYWPLPPNYLSSNTVTDFIPNAAVTTTWTSERWRAYMARLAWQIQWPGWPNPGMMDHLYYPTQGTTLYGMQGALNWEASGENSSTYFYVIVWNVVPQQASEQATFHSRVVDDIYNSSVPVVAEVNANMLPNWRRTGMNRHYITILGYDDTAGIYYYTDTCGASTNCNSSGHGSDGGPHTVDQTTMWNAIYNIPPTPVPGDPTQGDGGYIW